MFGAVQRAWAWFIGGLTEALLWCIGRLTRRSAYRVEIAETETVLRAPAGAAVARLVETAGAVRLEPPDVAKRLASAGIDIDIEIPAGWLFRRVLDPVAVESAPYLDAFVRHHIERITPWRVGDVFYRIVQAPLPGDATKLALEVAVVPRRLVAGFIEALREAGPRGLRLVARSGPEAPPLSIPLGDNSAERQAALHRKVAIGIMLLALATAGAGSLAFWQLSAVNDEIKADDQIIADRNDMLAAAARRDASGRDAQAALAALRRSRRRAVDMIEALSAALPDNAYLTDLTIDKDKLTISGISTDASTLVPALETSGRFADVAFSAATTRLDSGPGDRFHLSMRATKAVDTVAARESAPAGEPPAGASPAPPPGIEPNQAGPSSQAPAAPPPGLPAPEPSSQAPAGPPPGLPAPQVPTVPQPGAAQSVAPAAAVPVPTATVPDTWRLPPGVPRP